MLAGKLALVTGGSRGIGRAIVEHLASDGAAVVGQARNRSRRAVERTVPFGLLCVSLVVCWYALCGRPTLDVAACHARAPWYRTKHAVSFADMLTALRRAIIASQSQPGQQLTPTPAEILQVQQAWAAAAA